MAMAARLLLLAGVLLTAACSSIPETELNAYTSAFTQARGAGEAIVLDMDAAIAEQRRRVAARQPATARSAPAPIPIEYAPPGNGTAAPDAIKVRLLAWEAIDEYNRTLAALNAGESVDSVRSTAGRLFALGQKLATVAGGAVPGGAAAAGAAQELAARLEQARLAREFKRAIVGGVPTVRRMLAVFVADTRDHYRLRASLAAVDYERVRFETGLAARDQDLKRARIKAAIDDFRASLDNYVRLLDQVDRSLAALQAALDRPIDFETEANRIIDIVIDLRQRWVAYQNART